MTTENGTLQFGVSYCPYAKSGDVDMSRWEADVLTMKELHFTTIRCFVAWDRIEREEGVFDFNKQDYLFELARRHRMRLILNIGGVFPCYGGIYPPRWLLRNYDCQEVVANPCLPGRGFSPTRSLCMDDECFRRKAMAFTVTMLQRYAGAEELSGWNVWNEAFQREFCYCPLTLGKFRTWLQRRYGGLDALNEAWGSEFPVDFVDWEEVEPGLKAGFTAGGYVARMDWIRFNREQVAGWIDGVDALVREHDRLGRPTTTNVVVSAAMDASSHLYPDIWSQERGRDIAGFSLYSFVGAPWQIAEAASLVRSASADPEGGFWVLETEAGQVKRPETPGNTDLGKRLASHWQAVLHGARTILLWKYGGRVSDSQIDSYNLVAWDGAVTERALANAGFAKIFLGHPELFAGRRYLAQVAIFYCNDTQILAQAEGSYAAWLEARHGAYRLLHDLRVPADFIDAEGVLDGRLQGYRVLLLPHVVCLSPKVADAVRQFALAGGTVLADMHCGRRDLLSRQFARAPGCGLHELFGAYIHDQVLCAEEEKMCGPESAFQQLPVSAYWHAELNLAGASAMASYRNGRPAVSRARLAGGGAAWLFGDEVFALYARSASAEWRRCFEVVLAEAGVRGDFAVEGDPDGCVESGALTGNDGRNTYFLINFSAQARRLKVRIGSSDGRPLDNLLPGDACRPGADGFAEMNLPPWGCAVLFDPATP